MPARFNEATRVQMPALVHLARLGYQYYGKIRIEDKGTKYDGDTNILLKVFEEQFKKLNPEREGDFVQVLRDIKKELDDDDLGKGFYKRLISVSPYKLVDFENPDNNTFHFTGEFTCERDGDSFRPDITLFINGLPLCFIEVKKPNNTDGIRAEIRRMNNERFPNKKFRRFINITQLMIFSNNMEYDTLDGIAPVQGAFYCTASKSEAKLNCFREENRLNEPIAPFHKDFDYIDVDETLEKKILADYNCQVLYSAPEYQTNKRYDTPTNRIITSMCSKERILFLIRYGIAYVKDQREVDGVFVSIDEKQIMRYQQMFAALAIREKIDKGMKSGVLWHTQGSGKTALAYYLNYVLSDYFAKKNMVAKFYFIVDRLDLLEQASQEFQARGLDVQTANTRAELMAQFRTNSSLQGTSGRNEIIVVNIQRFAEDREKIELPNQYNTNLQRIFIIDEAHRGYKPEGSFLYNLFEADKNSVKIALTGTPLLKQERASWKIFGNYYHTYYYDKSIKDGYTLKVMREPIETSYKEKLSEIYEKLEKLVQKKDVPRSVIIEHDNYVKELLRYIISDLIRFRTAHADQTLGGMIIAETSEQARKLYQYFDEILGELSPVGSGHALKAGLILHDYEDKETRTQIIKDFKKNMTIDLLIVYNMLLTGFDAPRLKRLYFGRKLKDHSLLQAITRVNRPYKENRYGYVIDFADIKQNFDETNAAYLRELERFNDPDEVGITGLTDTFAQVIEDKDALIEKMREAQDVVFRYPTDNAEEFSKEVSEIDNKETLLKIKNALVTIRDCYNIGRTFGDDDLKSSLEVFQIMSLPALLSSVQHCIDAVNLKAAITAEDETRRTINEAMAGITFRFEAQGDEVMNIVDGGGEELQRKWSEVISQFAGNIDQDDPKYISLRDAFLQRFNELGFVYHSENEYDAAYRELDDAIAKLKELKRENDSIARRYNGDVKFVRAHKRIVEQNQKRKERHENPIISQFEMDIRNALNEIKATVDQKVYDRNNILKQDAYFKKTVMQLVSEGLDRLNLNNTRADRLFIQDCIVAQYLSQYHLQYNTNA